MRSSPLLPALVLVLVLGGAPVWLPTGSRSRGRATVPARRPAGLARRSRRLKRRERQRRHRR